MCFPGNAWVHECEEVRQLLPIEILHALKIGQGWGLILEASTNRWALEIYKWMKSSRLSTSVK